jgi:SnoaL-like polyketide cyclase
MSAQENATLVRHEFDLLNAHQTDTEWLDKIVAPLSEDFVLVDVPTGTTSSGRDMPTGDVPPTGRSVEIHFCEVRRIANGKVMSLHSYYDALGFMQQLGFIPTQE